MLDSSAYMRAFLKSLPAIVIALLILSACSPSMVNGSSLHYKFTTGQTQNFSVVRHMEATLKNHNQSVHYSLDLTYQLTVLVQFVDQNGVATLNLSASKVHLSVNGQNQQSSVATTTMRVAPDGQIIEHSTPGASLEPLGLVPGNDQLAWPVLPGVSDLARQFNVRDSWTSSFTSPFYYGSGSSVYSGGGTLTAINGNTVTLDSTLSSQLDATLPATQTTPPNPCGTYPMAPVGGNIASPIASCCPTPYATPGTLTPQNSKMFSCCNNITPPMQPLPYQGNTPNTSSSSLIPWTCCNNNYYNYYPPEGCCGANPVPQPLPYQGIVPAKPSNTGGASTIYNPSCCSYSQGDSSTACPLQIGHAYQGQLPPIYTSPTARTGVAPSSQINYQITPAAIPSYYPVPTDSPVRYQGTTSATGTTGFDYNSGQLQNVHFNQSFDLYLSWGSTLTTSLPVNPSSVPAEVEFVGTQILDVTPAKVSSSPSPSWPIYSKGGVGGQNSGGTPTYPTPAPLP